MRLLGTPWRGKSPLPPFTKGGVLGGTFYERGGMRGSMCCAFARGREVAVSRCAEFWRFASPFGKGGMRGIYTEAGDC